MVFINTGQFYGVDLENCVLYVPAASVNKYKKDPNWGVFKKILPDIYQPDIDRSGIVDVEDVNKLINTFLGLGKPGCNATAADVNHDGMADIEDVNIIINTILKL